MHQEVEASRLRSLPDEVIVPNTVGVTVRIEDASLGQSALDVARSLGQSFTLPGTAPLAGLGVFVLAEVFAHGVGLREDVEGTV